jgi:hypothetical protein
MQLRPTPSQVSSTVDQRNFQRVHFDLFSILFDFGWPNRKGMVSESCTGEQVPFEPWRRDRDLAAAPALAPGAATSAWHAPESCQPIRRRPVPMARTLASPRSLASESAGGPMSSRPVSAGPAVRWRARHTAGSGTASRHSVSPPAGGTPWPGPGPLQDTEPRGQNAAPLDSESPLSVFPVALAASSESGSALPVALMDYSDGTSPARVNMIQLRAGARPRALATSQCQCHRSLPQCQCGPGPGPGSGDASGGPAYRWSRDAGRQAGQVQAVAMRDISSSEVIQLEHVTGTERTTSSTSSTVTVTLLGSNLTLK